METTVAVPNRRVRSDSAGPRASRSGAVAGQHCVDGRTTGTPDLQPAVAAAPRAEQEFLRLVVEQLADGVLIVDDNGVILFTNPAAAVLFGREPEELTGTEFGFPLVAGETAEVELVRPGGTLTAAELRTVDLSWNGDRARLLSLHDVTDRKRAQERLLSLADERAARAQVEAMSRAKSEFLAVMSHELRTPLNAILGYSDLLELGVSGPLTDAQREQLGRINASGRHLLTLVNELLDLSRVEAGKLAVTSGRHAAASVADAALTLIQPQADAVGLTLSRTEEIGNQAAYYSGDEDRVRQILLNLLSNAVKFTEPGGTIRLEVIVADEPEPGTQLPDGKQWVAFRVTDEGIGIPPDQLDAVFTLFKQVDAGHTRKHDGAGLGLTISRRLAQLMEGEITVKSVVREGSTFTLWLPSASSTRASDPAPANEAQVNDIAPTNDVDHFSAVGDLLLANMDSIAEAFMKRLREDPLIAGGRTLPRSQLADHVTTLLADVSATLVALEETDGRSSPLVSDSADIQRVLAEKHGSQRARLAWTDDMFRRESVLLREVVDIALRSAARDRAGHTLDGALRTIERLLLQSERIGLRALDQALKKSS